VFRSSTPSLIVFRVFFSDPCTIVRSYRSWRLWGGNRPPSFDLPPFSAYLGTSPLLPHSAGLRRHLLCRARPKVSFRSILLKMAFSLPTRGPDRFCQPHLMQMSHSRCLQRTPALRAVFLDDHLHPLSMAYPSLSLWRKPFLRFFALQWINCSLGRDFPPFSYPPTLL